MAGGRSILWRRKIEGCQNHKRPLAFWIEGREIVCPNCNTSLILSSPMSTIFMARKTCQHCKKDFVIEEDVPKAMAGKETAPLCLEWRGWSVSISHKLEGKPPKVLIG